MSILALIVKQAAPFIISAVSDTLRKPKTPVVQFKRVSRKLAWASMGAAVSGLLVPLLGSPSPDLVNLVSSVLMAVTDLSGEAADGWAPLGASLIQAAIPVMVGAVSGYRARELQANVAG